MTGSGRDPGVTGCWAAGAATAPIRAPAATGSRRGRATTACWPAAWGATRSTAAPARPTWRSSTRSTTPAAANRSGCPSSPVDRNALRLHEREHLAALIRPRLRKFRALASRRIGRRLGSRERRGDVHGQVCWPDRDRRGCARGPRVRRNRQRGGSGRHDRRGRQDRSGLRLHAGGPGARVHPAAGRGPGPQRPDGLRHGRHHPAEGVRRRGQGAGDHRSEPVLHDLVPRQRVAVHGGLGRRRCQRPLAVVLRQLLRAARIRVRSGPDARHRLHDGGLPESRRPGGHRRREVDRRLAQWPRARPTRRRT